MRTNWDQGVLTLEQLNEVYGKICRNHEANEKILAMIEKKTFSL